MQAKNTLMGSAPNLHMASGGVAVGRTYAEIGEGKYPEAVIPLSTQTYDEMGAGIARANGGATGGITLNVSALPLEIGSNRKAAEYCVSSPLTKTVNLSAHRECGNHGKIEEIPSY